MRTVAETEIFQRYSADVWKDGEREEFIEWIAAHPEAGVIITGSGGARIIYFLHLDETVWLLIVYKKAKFDNLPTAFIAQLRKAVQDAL